MPSNISHAEVRQCLIFTGVQNSSICAQVIEVDVNIIATTGSWVLVGVAASLAHTDAFTAKLGQLEADLAHLQTEKSASRHAHPLDLLDTQVT